MIPFNIVPLECVIAYECSCVTRLAGDDSSISCDSFGKIDLLNDEDSNGILKFVANKVDYISGKYIPRQYEVTITGFAIESLDTATATFVLSLIETEGSITLISPYKNI